MQDTVASGRSQVWQQLRDNHFDLLVIGGGITGAGIALDAASRGLKTALLEQHDFAFGTSSRSTKLIHGGLRYLKQLEFGLVKEVGSERAIVHRLAPHLVVPEKMLLPLSEKRGLGYWLTSIGLKIYDWLAGVKAEDQRRMLTRQQTLRYEPLLRPDDVSGGAIYAEYRTDDARLTIEIMKTAQRHGAVLANYVRVEDFIYHDGRITGVKATVDTGETLEVHASVVVSAAGPWVDQLRERNHSRQGKRLHLTKGVHLVVAREKLPVRQAIYFDVDDGRMIFAIPRSRTTYIGTTDTNYTGTPEQVVTSPEDAAYLIRAVNATFPSVQLTLSDIESSWAGLRPLIHEDGKSASELSRKDEIFESDTGLISIAGGKLTGYRKMAERVVSLVIRKHFAQRSFQPCYTDRLVLMPQPLSHVQEAARYRKRLQDHLPMVPAEFVEAMVESFGTQCDIILSDVQQNATQHDVVLAITRFCIQYEYVQHLTDVMVRRTGWLYFNMPLVRESYLYVAACCQQLLGWTDEQRIREEQALLVLMREAADFHQQAN